jgi:hypothetical protein
MSKVVSTALLATVLVFWSAGMLLAGEECEGNSIKAINEDPCELTLKIGVEDSATVCQILCVFENPEDPGKTCGINPSWIGGIVVEEDSELRFNFDPATVRIAEIVIEQLQTNTCQIAENPEDYIKGMWYIPYNVTEVEQ